MTWNRAENLQHSLDDAREELKKAQANADDRGKKLAAEREWVDLLWATGKNHLQPLVGRALRELGIPVVDGPTEPTELQDFELETEESLVVIEVTGSKGEIGLPKGRQLAHWVTAGQERLVTGGKQKAVAGVLIANTHREVEPSERPEPFSQHLTTFARMNGHRLVTTRELFDLVTSDDAHRTAHARSLLGLPTK